MSSAAADGRAADGEGAAHCCCCSSDCLSSGRKITPSVEQLVAQRSNLMQLLSVLLVRALCENAIRWSHRLHNAICESMLCNTYENACKQ